MGSRRLVRFALGVMVLASVAGAQAARADGTGTSTACRDLGQIRLCVVVEVSATRVPVRLCPGSQGPGQACYRKVEAGRAYVEAPLPGVADFFSGGAASRCAWGAGGGSCSIPDMNLFEFDTARPQCFEAWGWARVDLPGDAGRWIMTATAVVAVDCPA